MKVKKVKLCEVQSDTEHINIDNVKKILESKKAIKDYAYILHNKDVNENGELKKEHYHIALRLHNSYTFSCIANWFGIPSNFVCTVKGEWVDMLKYLTHQNALEKYQYDENEVISNYNWKEEKEKLISKSNSEARKEEIINSIVNGEIRQYNYFEYITAIENDKYKRSIDNAFKYRIDKIKGGNKDMNCIYICGASGTGKTTYAKMLAQDKGYSYYVSSGSNDVLDGYAGQDCLILDDLRPSCLGLSDLLKMLDNNTSSSVKSRFYNKVLECKLVIITSVLKLDEFFKNVFAEQQEPIVQLKRRCRLYLKFENDYYTAYCYNDKLNDYDYANATKFENPVSAIYSKRLTTKEEQLDFMKNMLLSESKMISNNVDSIVQAVPGLDNKVISDEVFFKMTNEERNDWMIS